MTDQPLTRRQLREQAAAEPVAPSALPVNVETPGFEVSQSADLNNRSSSSFGVETHSGAEPIAPAPQSRREARLQLRAEIGGSAGSDLFSQQLPLDQSVEIDDIQLPATGPIKTLEPTAIVVDAVPDITNMSVVLPESGIVIQTGAIDLPWLKAESSEIQIVTEAAAVADAVAGSEAPTTGINPIPARVHERTRRKASVFPNKLRRGWGVVYLTAISAFLLGALFCAFLAAFMLGLIKL